MDQRAALIDRDSDHHDLPWSLGVRTRNADFHVTTQNIEEAEQSLSREAIEPAFDDGGDFGLADAENLPGLCLREAAFLYDPVNMDR